MVQRFVDTLVDGVQSDIRDYSEQLMKPRNAYTPRKMRMEILEKMEPEIVSTYYETACNLVGAQDNQKVVFECEVIDLNAMH